MFPGGACSYNKSCTVHIQAFFSAVGKEGEVFLGGCLHSMFKTKRLFMCLILLDDIHLIPK